MEPTVLEVVVPPGVGVGEAVSFAGPNGEPLEAIVPDGCCEGDVFQVTIDDDGNPVPMYNSFVELRAASGDIMDQFVAWFERESVGDQVDAFVKQNAHLLGGGDTSGEQSHECAATPHSSLASRGARCAFTCPA